jgi:hypothetical protein
MLRKLEADLQALIAGQILVEIAVRLFSFSKVCEALNRFLHAK